MRDKAIDYQYYGERSRKVVVVDCLPWTNIGMFVQPYKNRGCLISCAYEWPSGEEALNIIPGRCQRLLYRVIVTFVVKLIGRIVTTKEV